MKGCEDSARIAVLTRHYSDVLLQPCDMAAWEAGHKKSPRQGRGTRRSAAMSERRPCRRHCGRPVPGGAQCWSGTGRRAGRGGYPPSRSYRIALGQVGCCKRHTGAPPPRSLKLMDISWLKFQLKLGPYNFSWSNFGPAPLGTESGDKQQAASALVEVNRIANDWRSRVAVLHFDQYR
jgi:hypothetical protein